MGKGSRGRYVFRFFVPLGIGDDRIGCCFKETCWGNSMVRWVWLRFSDGTEKAFAPSHLRSATAKDVTVKPMVAKTGPTASVVDGAQNDQ